MNNRKIGKHPALAAPYGSSIPGWHVAALEAARRDFDAVELAALEAPLSAAGLRSSWYLDHAETLLHVAEMSTVGISKTDKPQDNVHK